MSSYSATWSGVAVEFSLVISILPPPPRPFAFETTKNVILGSGGNEVNKAWLTVIITYNLEIGDFSWQIVIAYIFVNVVLNI